MVFIFGFEFSVRLCENSSVQINDYGYVCDTEKQVEMLLSEYLSKYILKNNCEEGEPS